MIRAILIFGIAAVLMILTIENGVTVLPLVVLGQSLLALPLSVWMLGAIAAGSATTLLFAGLVQLGAARRSDAYAPNVSYGFRTPPEPKPPTDRARQRASAAAAQEVWDDPQWSSTREPGDRQSRRTSDDSAATSESRSYRSTYQPSEPPARSTPSSDDWEDRRPLNLDSWEDWGAPSRSASAPPNRTAQTPFNPPPYRPPTQTYPASTPYVPPVVDAEVVTPRRPAEEDDSDEDYYLDEDEYQTGSFSEANAADRYGQDVQREAPETYERQYREPSYQTDYRDDPRQYQDEGYHDSVDERPEPDEPGWRDYGDRDTSSNAYDYTSSNDYADDYSDAEDYDDVEPEDYAAPFPLYREPGTEFQWPVQPDDDDRPDANEVNEDVWESWEDRETYRASNASNYSVNEPPPSPDAEPSDPDLDVWDEWDDATEGDRPPSPPEPTPSEPRVIITEVQGTPVVQNQTGTLYSYSYRRTEDTPHPADSPPDEDRSDAGDRVLITPPAPAPDDDTKPEGEG